MGAGWSRGPGHSPGLLAGLPSFPLAAHLSGHRASCLTSPTCRPARSSNQTLQASPSAGSGSAVAPSQTWAHGLSRRLRPFAAGTRSGSQSALPQDARCRGTQRQRRAEREAAPASVGVCLWCSLVGTCLLPGSLTPLHTGLLLSVLQEGTACSLCPVRSRVGCEAWNAERRGLAVPCRLCLALGTQWHPRSP